MYIIFDAGHGGKDNGALGVSSKEKDINLQICLKISSILSKKMMPHFLTRIDNSYLTLRYRCTLVNLTSGSLLISVHCNAFKDRNVQGIETYYFSNAGKIFAEKIQTSLIINTKAKNRGIKWRNFYVLRRTKMPAILIECGFITNLEEEKKLCSENYQNKIIKSIL